jgi:hypothetical protein
VTQPRIPRQSSPARAAAFRLVDLRGRKDPVVLTPGSATECAPGVHVTVGSADGEALVEVTGRRAGASAATSIDGVEVVDVAQLAPGQVISGEGFTWVYLKPLQAFIFKRENEDEATRLARLEALLGSERFHALLSSRPPEKLTVRRKATEVVPLRAVPAKQQRALRPTKPGRSRGARLVRLSLALLFAAGGAGAVLFKDRLTRLDVPTTEPTPTPIAEPKAAAPAPKAQPTASAAALEPPPASDAAAAPAAAPVAAPVAAAPVAPPATTPKAPRVAASAPKAGSAPWIKPGKPGKLTPASTPAGALAQKTNSSAPKTTTKTKTKAPPPPPVRPAPNPESFRPQFQEAVLLKGFDPQGALRDLRALSGRVPPGSPLGKDIQREITQLERR